jgi:hypothetical protein
MVHDTFSASKAFWLAMKTRQKKDSWAPRANTIGNSYIFDIDPSSAELGLI